MFTVDGDQAPVIPSFEVGGKLGAAVPEQNGGICVNVGVTGGPTVTVSCAVSAHCPASGVKV